MSKLIRLVPKEESGVDGGVEMIVNCVATEFLLGKDGKPQSIMSACRSECKMMASVERGTVSLSARDVGHMITVRIEELQALLREAEKMAHA